MKNPKITVSKNGPYQVSGSLPLSEEKIVPDENGDPLKWEKGKDYPQKRSYDLCRCGQSKHKPFCDGSHAYASFDGTETADQKKYLEQAEKTEGPDLELTDAVKFCSSAKFCQRAGGTWELTKNSNDPKSKETAIQQACDCPSGRLVAWDKKTSQPIEPELEPSVSLEENPSEGVSGPIRVKGGVSVESADGKQYEIRNRATLCRCGKSKNKPFCDGVHLDVGFNSQK
ncbi:MAG TPA: CDGSH iron-sulfur domain-containing protein [Patescibacteria group bacterium]